MKNLTTVMLLVIWIFKDKNLLPLEAIGKVQVYSYKFVNDNKLEFYVDKEFDFLNSQVLRNVKYIFVKKE